MTDVPIVSIRAHSGYGAASASTHRLMRSDGHGREFAHHSDSCGARSIAKRNSRCVGAASTSSSTYHARKSALAKSAIRLGSQAISRTLSGRRASTTSRRAAAPLVTRTQKK